MTVELSVKDVRDELARAAGARDVGEGEPATLLLGRIFHEVFADLVGRDPARNGARVLLEAGREAGLDPLVTHVYRALVGPRITRHRAHLSSTSSEVLVLWSAAQALARWLAEITWAVVDARRDRPSSWEEIADLMTAEASLACELREPGWTDTVRLVGVADSLIQIPRTARFCAVELKLGRARPAVDLGQAALYRLIVARASASRRDEGSVALMRFSPALEETLIDGSELADVEAHLCALIGKMAGVVGDGAAATPSASPARYDDLARSLGRAYREYGRAIEITAEPAVGPRFLRFFAKLGRGVTFDQIARQAKDVGLKLGLVKEPIVSRARGRLAIDVARPDPQIVPFSAIAPALAARAGKRGSALVPIGIDLDGDLLTADLASPISAHVLVAGTTGSGKTEWLRAAIAGLLVANTPDSLRLVLIDPKLAAFGDLKRSPFLFPPHGVWTPGDGDAVEVLEDLVAEMDRRYRLLASEGVDDLDRYLDKTGRVVPRIVCFCDEYFALVSQDRAQKKAVEAAITLLGAKARAAGIHLVIATQQPSRQIIQGALDANMPCRVGLMTQSAIESRMLLGVAGAERLTGYGDLLYKDVGEPVRLQAAYVTPNERARLFA